MSFSGREHVHTWSIHTHTHTCMHTSVYTYRVIHNSLTLFIKSGHLNDAKDSTCDPHIDRETLQVYLYVPQALSFIGGHQGIRLNENGSNRSREGFLLFEYAQTQSVVTVQQSFQAKVGKDIIKQWYEKFHRNRYLCNVKCPG